ENFQIFGNLDDKVTDVDDLETILNQIMADEFNTLLEDNLLYISSYYFETSKD
ncbi:1160_t:CDS:1, partial [Funneliformis caledonium]